MHALRYLTRLLRTGATPLVLLLLLLALPALAQRPDSLVTDAPTDTLTQHIMSDSVRAAVQSGLELLAPTVPPSTTLRDFAYADSLTYHLWQTGRWPALDSVGRAALAVGTDYPALRQRLGDAAYQQQHYAGAVRHYGRALAANPADEGVRRLLALAHLQLGQRDAATYHARFLPDSVRQELRLPLHLALRDAELEAGGIGTTSRQRGRAAFGLFTAASQLNSWLVLTHTVAHYRQTVQLPAERNTLASYAVRQWEYQALLRAQLAPRWQLRTAYHYLHNDFGTAAYPGHLWYAALVYQRPAWQLRAGAYAGRLTDTARTQLDAQLTWYPLGSLRLYTFGRASVVRSGARTYPTQLLGVGQQLGQRLWLEGFVGTGRVPVLAESDGTYVYNLLDPLRRRLGISGYYVLPHHLRLQARYVLKNRFLTPLNTSYTQFSLTGGLAWTW